MLIQESIVINGKSYRRISESVASVSDGYYIIGGKARIR